MYVGDELMGKTFPYDGISLDMHGENYRPSVVVFGTRFAEHLSVAVLTVGWVCAQCAVMMNTSAVCEYLARACLVGY